MKQTANSPKDEMVAIEVISKGNEAIDNIERLSNSIAVFEYSVKNERSFIHLALSFALQICVLYWIFCLIHLSWLVTDAIDFKLFVVRYDFSYYLGYTNYIWNHFYLIWMSISLIHFEINCKTMCCFASKPIYCLQNILFAFLAL